MGGESGVSGVLLATKPCVLFQVDMQRASKALLLPLYKIEGSLAFWVQCGMHYEEDEAGCCYTWGRRIMRFLDCKGRDRDLFNEGGLMSEYY